MKDNQGSIGNYMEHHLLTYPTWERYTVLSHVISNLSIRDRRQIFMLARNTPTCFSTELFFPHFGFTLAEFAVWYTLGDNRRKVRKKNSEKGGGATHESHHVSEVVSHGEHIIRS